MSIPFEESGSNRGRNFTDGSENLRGSQLTEYDTEASDNSGASSVTWSNDYAAIRNFMKDGGAEDIAPIGENVERQFSLANTKAIAPLPGDIYGKDIALPSALEDVAPIMEDISKSSVDRGVVFGYDSSINDTEGGVISNEQRAETRESFHGRANEKGYTVRERGKISCGYYPVTDKTGRAGRTEKALQELGIPVVVHKGLEANVDGVTRSIQGDATSLAGDAVYVWSSTLNWSLCRMSKAKPRS